MKRQLEQRLSDVADFRDPSAALEQYRTPAAIAAHLLTLADLYDDVEDRTVVDFGSGTGMLAIGAAFLAPDRVIGLEIDTSALEVAKQNEARITPPLDIDWIVADATRVPICSPSVTAVSNPPFGAHSDNRNADRRFLEAISDVATVSYTIHNEGSREFVESFADDHGGTVTHAFQAEFSLPRQFYFHASERRTIQAEVFRIEWPSGSRS
ncbi:MAG: METTL5 family protein [Halodesulfurarchaeum sp.]